MKAENLLSMSLMHLLDAGGHLIVLEKDQRHRRCCAGKLESRQGLFTILD